MISETEIESLAKNDSQDQVSPQQSASIQCETNYVEERALDYAESE